MSAEPENTDELAALAAAQLGTQPHAGPRPASNTLTMLAAMMIFCASATGGIKIGLRAGNAIILRYVYGAERVATEHLEIVSSKKDIIVSNGDVLKGYNFAHFLIVVPLFLSIGVVGTVGGIFLLPLAMRERWNQNQRNRDGNMGWLPAILFLPLAMFLLIAKSLWPNVIVFALALAIAWMSAALVRGTTRG
ncbi:MAG TPA: hypothetical protein VH518_01485 [Tepidisphaeraceae bacterium]